MSIARIFRFCADLPNFFPSQFWKMPLQTKRAKKLVCYCNQYPRRIRQCLQGEFEKDVENLLQPQLQASINQNHEEVIVPLTPLRGVANCWRRALLSRESSNKIIEGSMLVCAARMFPKRGKYDRRSSLKQHLLNDFLQYPSCNISHPLLCMVVPFVKSKGMQKPMKYFLQACRKPFRTWFKYKYRLKLDLSSGSFISGPSKKDKRAHNIHHTQCKNYQAALVTFLPARSIAIFQ